LTTPTAAELTRLRTRPHRTVLHLGVYEPTTAFAARINQPGIGLAAREISVTTLSGNPDEVVNGMTVYIGTFPGGKDISRLRVIRATSIQIVVAENGITWEDGWYLTVARYFEPWAVFPRIVLDANNIPIFYKDYDLLYSGQNQLLEPIVNMGPHHAGYLETGAHSVYYSSSGTYDPTPGGDATGFAWVFEGGMPSSSLEPHPGWIQYTGCGHFTTSLEVTTSNGQTFTGRRHISIYSRPYEGACRPIVRWGLRSFEGSRGDGGYALRLWVRELADQAKLVDGALIVIFAESWEGSVKGKVGGNAQRRDDVLFVGYVEDGSIQLTPDANALEFRVSSITGLMSDLSTYSATLESKTTAGTWNELREMTVDRSVAHFLRWHSTVLTVADFAPTGDLKPVQFADFSRGNLYEAIDGLYQSALGAKLVSDRQGKMWAEVDVNLLPTGAVRAAIPTTMTLTRQDWRSALMIEREFEGRLAYLEMGGIAYSGPATGTFDPFLAGAPGEAAGYFGSVDRVQGLVLESQEQLNAFVGMVFARENAVYPEVTVPFPGDYRVIDIAPQARLLLNLAASENFRGIQWVNKAFLPEELSLAYDPVDDTLIYDGRLREETAGRPGITIIIPVEPPYDDIDLPEWQLPAFPLIPFPGLFPPISPQPPGGETVYAMVFAAADWHLYRTRNFLDASPTWEEITSPFATLGAVDIDWFFSPVDPVNIAFAFAAAGGGNPNRFYLTNTLDSASPVWQQYWGAAEDALLGGTPQNIGQAVSPTLGYHVYAFKNCVIDGAARGAFVYGSPGSFTFHAIDAANIAGFSCGRNTPPLHIGGSSIILGIDNHLARSDALGVGSASWGLFSNSPNRCADTVYDGAGMVFTRLNNAHIEFDPYSWAFPIVTTRFVDITPTYLGVLYGDNGGDTVRRMVFAGGYTYAALERLSGVSTPPTILFRRAPGGTFQPVSIENSGHVGSITALEPFVPNPLLWVARASNTIIGSIDGGFHWTDKTGNLAVLTGGASAIGTAVPRFSFA
jgi:hypothetical protein